MSFTGPFRLPEIDGEQPAGTYDVETDEEAIEGNERTVYVPVATLIHLHKPGSTGIVTIDPKGLDAVLLEDRAIGSD